VDPVAQIARAVLYEGYLLWPYRRSALKNQHRFTLGGLYPASYARRFADRSEAACEVILQGPAASVEVEVRFLQLVRRQVVVDGAAVDDAVVDGRRYLTWDETIECTQRGAGEFVCDADKRTESLSAHAALVRTWNRIEGSIALHERPLGEMLRRVRVEISNRSALSEESREAALTSTMLACHAVLRTRGGAFVSSVDPPAGLGVAVAGCRNEGLWPVLVGERRARDTILAAPIILEEYPEVSNEMPCDFFDGAEVGELLARSILGLTDAERDEMRGSDPHGRAILERVEAMTPAELSRLHAKEVRSV
jgi:hydrogenase maturation protease